jgi:methylated-DNA-[protein]-cysteine S-methyltransferase
MQRRFFGASCCAGGERMLQTGLAYHLWQAPIGWLGLVCGKGCLVEIVSEPQAAAVRGRIGRLCPEAQAQCSAVCAEAVRQLDDYFHGRRRRFELPLAMDTLTPFTAKVLRTLAQVPFGSTLTYGELAALAGYPRAARAVGRVMATNPFPIIIPCHRVLGTDGKMTGYSGGEGIATKQWLLCFEAEKSLIDD